MHEMAIAESLLAMAEEEMARQHCTRLELVRVQYGAISGLVPEALQFCFESMLKGSAHEGCKLEMECLPLRLRCSACGAVFGGEKQDVLYHPCPHCGEEFGHVLEQGKELILSHLEAR